MKKIALITDTTQSAIARLANGLNSPDIDYRKSSFHPKKPNHAEIDAVKKLFNWADLIHIQYWKSGSKIKEMFPVMWDSKPKILTHYNPYNLHEENWSDYKKLVVVNQTQQKGLPQATLIPLCIDTSFFKYNPKYVKRQNIVHMSVARIEGKKGVKEVAQACGDLGYKFILVGRPSDPQYVKSVLDVGKGMIDYRQNISDEALRSSYYQSAIHVCNSVDNFESGTMPVLEAMSCGIAVLARPVGHVPDLYNGNNLELLECEHNNVECLKVALANLMSDRTKRLEMIQEALITVKDRGNDTWNRNHKELYEHVCNSRNL